MSSSASWTIRLDVAAFATVEDELVGFLGANAVEGRAAYVSQLVIEEIVRNLIEHTPPYAPLETVTVSIVVDAQDVRVVIEDSRPPFNPFDAPELDVRAPLHARRPGGMGLHLVRTLTDTLTYERSSGRNRLSASVSRS